jgi:hypothetical protein
LNQCADYFKGEDSPPSKVEVKPDESPSDAGKKTAESIFDKVEVATTKSNVKDWGWGGGELVIRGDCCGTLSPSLLYVSFETGQSLTVDCCLPTKLNSQTSHHQRLRRHLQPHISRGKRKKWWQL